MRGQPQLPSAGKRFEADLELPIALVAGAVQFAVMRPAARQTHR
jgi:hypothetical protein